MCKRLTVLLEDEIDFEADDNVVVVVMVAETTDWEAVDMVTDVTTLTSVSSIADNVLSLVVMTSLISTTAVHKAQLEISIFVH